MAVCDDLGRVNGTFALESASISVAESVTESAVRAVVAAGSFHTGAARRDDHVRSPAFLDSDRHPAIRFESSGAVRGDDDVWTMEGSLTVRGHRAPVPLTIDSLALRDGSLRLSLTATAPPTAGPTTNPTAHPTAHPALGTATRAVVPAEEAEEDAVPEAGCRVVAGGVRAGVMVTEGAGVVAPAVALQQTLANRQTPREPDRTGRNQTLTRVVGDSESVSTPVVRSRWGYGALLPVWPSFEVSRSRRRSTPR